MTDTLFDPATGELLARGQSPEPEPVEPEDDVESIDALADECTRCAATAEEKRLVQVDLALSELEVRNLRRKVGKLQAEITGDLRSAKERPMVVEVFDHWVEVTGRNRKRVKLGEKREKAILARLREGYEVDYLKQAIDGAVLGAHVDADTKRRYDDIELICRDEVKVERFWGIAQEALAAPSPSDDPPPPEDPPWI